MQAAVALRERRPERTLVLNADYQPLSTWPLSLIPVENAIHALCRDRVVVVETWDEVFRSPSTEIRAPKVVALKHYAPVFGEPKFCRRNVLLRDRFCCQYCGEKRPSHELTFDHVIPRSRGGRTTWENILTACVDCNSRKGALEPNFSGRRGVAGNDGRMRPLKVPRRPTSAELFRLGLELLPDDIREDFGSWLYWSTSLEG